MYKQNDMFGVGWYICWSALKNVLTEVFSLTARNTLEIKKTQKQTNKKNQKKQRNYFRVTRFLKSTDLKNEKL